MTAVLKYLGTATGADPRRAVVSGLVDAYHHNRLVAEIEAIEPPLMDDEPETRHCAWLSPDPLHRGLQR
jgi:hypothetical protein